MKFRAAAMRFPVFAMILFQSVLAVAGDFQVEKQKLKFSFEYENFVDEIGNEVRTPGIKATYLLKTNATLAKKLTWSMDLQTGLKTNLDTTFQSGDLSRATWSNRANLQASVPIGRFYLGGGFYFRNKWLSEVPRSQQFVDIFGGVGFRESSGTIQGGVALTQLWDLSGALQYSDLRFAEYPLSNSNWSGGNVRLSRKFNHFRVNTFYRARNVDYNRPVFLQPVPFIPFTATIAGDLQHDRFREGGAGIEFSRPFYFAGTYSYQVNNSNNPGFSYHNHQISLLVGTELSHNWYVQAYGIVQRFSFLEEDGFLPFPLLVGENDDNNMAASLVRTLGSSTELEFGIQYLTHSSSFAQLNASKTILYAAYNYRF